MTCAQLHRHLGSLPVAYPLLEVLQVQEIINRHCPTAAEVDHGTVALVLILNGLVAPRPLYRLTDWLSRTLDALSQHSREIWQDIVHRALIQADIVLTVIFYDLTAFVVHGAYADSQHVDFGFAAPQTSGGPCWVSRCGVGA